MDHELDRDMVEHLEQSYDTRIATRPKPRRISPAPGGRLPLAVESALECRDYRESEACQENYSCERHQAQRLQWPAILTLFDGNASASPTTHVLLRAIESVNEAENRRFCEPRIEFKKRSCGSRLRL